MIGNRCRWWGLACKNSESEMKVEPIEFSYVVKFEEAVYVLHVFEKRSQKTARADLELDQDRYAALLRWRKGDRS